MVDLLAIIRYDDFFALFVKIIFLAPITPRKSSLPLINVIRKKCRIRNRLTTIKLQAKQNRKTKIKTETTTNTITTNKSKLSLLFVNSQGSFFSHVMNV